MSLIAKSKKVIATIAMSTALLIVPITSNVNEASAASTINSTQLINTAKGLLGTKYVYGGTTPKGFDCSGFVTYVYKQLGISLPRTAASMYNNSPSVSKNSLKTGDLVFFNTSGKGVSHVGIYMGNGNFIHSANNGVVISKVNDPYYWGKRYVGGGRVADSDGNGWVKKSNSWFYYQNNQAATGWVKDAGKWYYLNGSGVMQTGWEFVGNKWYYMNSSGAMVTGWSKVGGKWYFHNSSGAMLTGWVKTGNKWYYLNANGDMAYNTTIENYVLGSDGAWIQ